MIEDSIVDKRIHLASNVLTRNMITSSADGFVETRGNNTVDHDRIISANACCRFQKI